MVTPVTPADRNRACQLILEIVWKAGGTFKNKTNLFKAFWWSHLAFARENPGYLSHWPIVKMPNGPGIHDFDMLLGDLVSSGKLQLEQVESGDFKAFVFKANPEASTLSNSEIAAITEGIEFVANRTAAEVSEESHSSRAWSNAAVGDELNIYDDLFSEEEHDRVSAILRDLD